MARDVKTLQPTNSRKREHFRSLLLLGLIFSLFSADAEAETFGQRHMRVCGNDSREKVVINTEVLQVLVKMKDYINQVAARFGTDPNVIAGAILTEHSLNTGAKDIAENFLVKIGATPTGEIFGKKFTFGFGQLHFERALAAEQVAASVEHRPIRNRMEISAAILSPEGSIEYIGALLKQEQDMYKAAGIDISKDPGVLATLYNIGKLDQRIQRTKAEKRMPEPNYFGCYVEHNLAYIQRGIASSHKVDLVSDSVVSAKSASPKNAAIAIDPNDSIELYQLRKDALLSNGPSACYDEPAFATNNKTIKGGDTIHILGKSVDCDLKPWVMVQNQDGVVGWLDRKKLSSNSDRYAGSIASNCEKVALPKKCGEDLKSQYTNFLSQNEKSIRFSLKDTAHPVYGAIDLKGLITGKTDTPIARDRYKMEKEWQISDANLAKLTADIPNATKALDALIDSEQKIPTKFSGPYSNLYPSVMNMLSNINAMLLEYSPYPDSDSFKNWPLIQKLVVALRGPKPNVQQLFDIINNEVNSYEDSEVKKNIKSLKAFLKWDFLGALPTSKEYTDKLAALDRCEKVIQAVIPDSAYMLAGIRSQLSTQIKYAAAQRYWDYSKVGKLWDGIPYLLETCATVQLANDPQLAKEVAAINPNCIASLADRGAEDFSELSLSLNAALGMTKSDDDRKSFLLAALTNVYTINSSASESGTTKQFSTLRDLENALSAESCLKNIYVPEPWLASKNNTLYRPTDNENEIDVENSYLSCKGNAK